MTWEQIHMPTSFLGQELCGKPIISVTDGNIVARLEDVLIDPGTQQVATLVTSRDGRFNKSQAKVIPSDAIEVWGRDAILISQPRVVVQADRLPSGAEYLSVSHCIMRCEATSKEGTHVGIVDDVVIDAHGQLVGYDFAEVSIDGSIAWSRRVAAGAVCSLSGDGLIVDLAQIQEQR
jgi:uncharacterized protein YrrD